MNVDEDKRKSRGIRVVQTLVPTFSYFTLGWHSQGLGEIDAIYCRCWLCFSGVDFFRTPSVSAEFTAAGLHNDYCVCRSSYYSVLSLFPPLQFTRVRVLRIARHSSL